MLTAREYGWSIRAGIIATTAIVLFIVIAAGALLWSGTGSLSGIFDAWTWRIVRFTLLQATLSTLLSVLLAIPVALALARQNRFPGRIWIIRFLAVPMGLPVLVGALGLIGIWGRQGSINTVLVWTGLSGPVNIYGLSGILLAHVFFNLPLATRMLLAGLERIPGEYWRVSAGLGMRPGSVFRLIEWPAMRKIIPGIAGLIFMLCATSFTLVLILGGGPAATTIEVAIYQALRFDFDPPRAIALSVMQIGMTAIILALLSLVPAENSDGHTHGRPQRRFDASGPGTRFYDGMVIGLLVLFIGLPLVSITIAGAGARLPALVTGPLFLRALATSLTIALSAALLAVACVMAMVAARSAIAANRKAGHRMKLFAWLMSGSSSLVLLVPPVVLGSGWFLLLHATGMASGAAPVLVTLINMLMALPFVFRILEPAWRSHKSRTSRLAASLGITGWTRLLRIDWPGLKRPVLTAMSFAMALSLGDLGAIALFGTEGFVTLPWLVYSNLGSYRTNDADGYALILGVICLLLAAAGAGKSDLYGKNSRGGHERQ